MHMYHIIGLSKILTNTYISGCLIEHLYIKNILLKDFTVNVKVQNIFFPDHHTVRIVFRNNKVHFSVSI